MTVKLYSFNLWTADGTANTLKYITNLDTLLDLRYYDFISYNHKYALCKYVIRCRMFESSLKDKLLRMFEIGLAIITILMPGVNGMRLP